MRHPDSSGVKPTLQPWHLYPQANHGSWNSSPPPQPPDCQRSTCTHTYKHTCVCTPRTLGEQAGTELVLDFIGGDSFSHFSVWITSSSWAMRGNEHCSTTKSRFRLTELVLGPVGFCCCCTAPPPDRTPTTAARDCVCVCVFVSPCSICVHMCVSLGRAYFEESERVGERERCVRFG